MARERRRLYTPTDDFGRMRAAVATEVYGRVMDRPNTSSEIEDGRGVITVPLIPLHRQLLVSARNLNTHHRQHQAAVVIAQTASEVQAERAITALLQRRIRFDPLYHSVSSYLPGYNMQPSNKKLRKLWESRWTTS